MTSAALSRLVQTEDTGARDPASYASVEQTIQPAELSARQMDVLRLMAEGLTDAEIGTQLQIRRKTVHTHAGLLFERLGARNRGHAIAIGFRRRLLS